MWIRRTIGGLVLGLVWASGAAAQPCAGDCDGGGQVTVDEVVLGVNVALGAAALDACAALDLDADGAVLVHELIAAVGNLLSGCPAPPTPTATPTGGIAAAVVRDAEGRPARLGERLTVEGVVTVSAGIFANNKLKVFAQDPGAAILVYHQSAADVDAFQAGDRIRATGVIREMDPTSDNNPATGTVHLDLSDGSWEILASNQPLPTPQAVTLAELAAAGAGFTGELVRVAGVAKIDGDWPALGGRSTQVTVSDDGGATALVLRLQRNTITAALVDELTAIADGPFTLTAIVVQDDGDGLPYDGGFELWLRGADDVADEIP